MKRTIRALLLSLALCAGVLFTWGRKPGMAKPPLYGAGNGMEAVPAKDGETSL